MSISDRRMNAIKLNNAAQRYGLQYSWLEVPYTAPNGVIVHEAQLFVFGYIFVGRDRKRGVARDHAAAAFFQAFPQYLSSQPMFPNAYLHGHF
ncbi:uncharacterized protein EI90DRAFT_3128198 [Cantharellus anzutake]|uniref:uncharacterized protein n=1 Tax=Cantharellus anzutake TaxID=1750568 RepID=UPI00190724E7|nr:uncharacterized protein EI90DRAFT_3128198 [Cantharellus anzutake]KAF8326052.1 hypothetical protein EI90DRAFT_3128198 [Cantharellus anzutake]